MKQLSLTFPVGDNATRAVLQELFGQEVMIAETKGLDGAQLCEAVVTILVPLTTMAFDRLCRALSRSKKVSLVTETREIELVGFSFEETKDLLSTLVDVE